MTDEPEYTDPNMDPEEIRLMAYILGELDGEEKAQIEARLESDAAFAEKREELEQAAELMKEASAIDLSFEDESVEPFQLTKERRESIFKEKPVKRSGLLKFNFNHPLIPVAVAASFFLILFSDRITVLRDGFFPTSIPESQRVEYNVQTAPPQFEEEGRERLGNYVDADGASFGQDSSPKDELSLADRSLSKEIVEKASAELPKLRDRRDLSEADETVRRQLRAEAEVRLNYSGPLEIPEPVAPQLSQLEVQLNPGGDDFKFSMNTLEQAKNDAPVIKLKKQDAAEIAANLPEMEAVPGRSPQLMEVAQAPVPEESDEVFELSPFQVDSSDDVGYRSTRTIGGSRLRRSSLGDVGYKAESVETLPFLHNTTVVTGESFEDSAPGWSDTGSAQNREVVSFFDANTSIPEPPPVEEGQQAGLGGIASGSVIAMEGGEKGNDAEALSLSSDLVASSELPSSLSEIQAPQIGQDPIEAKPVEADKAVEPVPSNPALIDYPEYLTADVPQSTFSLNVSDVSFRLAQSYLHNNQLPAAGTLRTEEFINAFEYGDPDPSMEETIGFSWDQARWPYHYGKDALRLSLKTAAEGRLDSQPMNLVLAIDSSGSMSRPDRLEIVEAMLSILGQELQESDRVSVIGFSQDARLILDSVSSESTASLIEVRNQLNPRGGTDLESGLRLAYETAARNFQSGAINRVILITDGAANLGNTVAEDLTERVINHRQAGIALDCFGIGFDGHNDVMLERLSRNGDGRYRFLRSVEEVQSAFGETLLGSLRPAAYDVKVQVEFNPDRVETYQLLGYQQHQLKSEDFRNNAVDAAEIGAAEAGNALYLINVDEAGRGDVGVVRARYRDASTGEYEERSWNIPYNRSIPDLDEAPAAMRLASVAASFAAKLNESPFADGIEFQSMIQLSQDLREFYPLDPDVIQLPNLLLKAQQLSGRQ